MMHTFITLSCIQELLTVYVSALRRFMVCVGVCVLLVVCVRYRDPVQQSLQVLQQLRETQRSLQEALQHAGEFSQQADTWENCRLYTKDGSRHYEGHPGYFCDFFMNA